jgi:quercetin dioxygenase-like cupin family protein
MLINNDMSAAVLLDAGHMNWVASPAAGVERRMLYREGGEIARATSIVRYAKGSVFPAHAHTGGEEILVLQGILQDEHGDYPQGSYFRNPPGTSHSPASAQGCEIFVRLWQFRLGDHAQIFCRPGEGELLKPRTGAKSTRLLFHDEAERVTLETWSPDANLTITNERGLEFMILSGSVNVRGKNLGAHGWGRLPAGEPLVAKAGPGGAQVWIKDAPLRHPDILPMPR